MTKARIPINACCLGICIILTGSLLLARYKARPWSLRERASYQSKLTSEQVTIAVEPLYRDELASQVFDKNDIVTRGIMPLAVVIFNDNTFPIVVDGSAVELIMKDERTRSLQPNEAVGRLFQKGGGSWLPQPLPRPPTGDRLNPEALEDFEHKFLNQITVAPNGKAGGFLYLPVPQEDLANYLSQALVYIPNIYREDTGDKLIFFEIELKPAIAAAQSR